MSFDNRNRPAGCSVCLNRTVLAGFNDLATTHPDIAAEWDSTKNGDVTPAQIVAGTAKKFWWKCKKCGHEWFETGNQRVSGRGCGACARRALSPGINDLATTHPDLLHEWHPTRNLPLEPNQIMSGSSTKVWWLCSKCGHEWKVPSAARHSGSGCPSCAGRLNVKPPRKLVTGTNDLATTHPELLSEWDYTNNPGLDPTSLLSGTNIKIWWKCSKDLEHRWQASVASRALAGKGCTFCGGRVLNPGTNDLQTVNPELASQWDREKNFPLEPSQVSVNSNRSFWWRDELGHSWKAVLANRNGLGRGCPFCGNHKALTGFNDLLTKFPEIAAEWDIEKNGTRSPSATLPGANGKVWWLCGEGHSYFSSPNARTSGGTGCAKCSNHGYNQEDDAWIYFLRHENWSLLQIGITNKPEQRLNKHQKLGWELINLRGPMDGLLAQQWETAMLRYLKKAGAKLAPSYIAGKFDGYTECWTTESFRVSSLKELMEQTELHENEP